jgi:hypothetical protein
MGAFEPTLDPHQRNRFLASMQQTRKAVLPIHNDGERALFRELMTSNTVFDCSKSEPDWDKAVKIWNAHADQSANIFYKVCSHSQINISHADTTCQLSEQLKVYYNGDWKTNSNIKQSLAMTLNVRVPLRKTLHDPARALPIPKLTQATMTLPSVSEGFLDPSSLSSPEHVEVEVEGSIPGARVVEPPATPSPSSLAHLLSMERTAVAIPPAPKPKERKVRTCQKCGIDDCPGKARIAYCKRNCRDCGKSDCKGRNSKRPDKKCHVAWD